MPKEKLSGIKTACDNPAYECNAFEWDSSKDADDK
jgi:hypothetical protein